MARLHVDAARLAQDLIVITDEDYHYLCRVLRLAAGDRVTLFDGNGGEADATLGRVGPRAVELHVGERRSLPPRRGPELTLVLGLLKGDKLDLVVQKATELGVARLLPVSTQRAVERLEAERARARRERWDKIAKEAARQSGRADVPEIALPVSLTEALASLPRDSLRLLFWEESRTHSLRAELPREMAPGAEVVIAIGPEGGFTSDEAAAARRAGFVPVGLGPRVLRAETAAIAALAVLGYALGDLGG